MYLLNAFWSQVLFLLKSQKAIGELLTLMYLYNNLSVVIELNVNLVDKLVALLSRPINLLGVLNRIDRHIIFHLNFSRCECGALGRANGRSKFY